MLRLTKRFVIAVLLIYLKISFAHPPGLSSADITLKADSLEAKITFSIQDIEAFVPMDSDQDAEVTDLERDAAKPAVAKLISEQFKITLDGGEIKPSSSGQVAFDDKNNTTVTLQFAASPTTTIAIESSFLTKFPGDHKQYLSIKDTTGREIGKKMLTPNAQTLIVNLANDKTDIPSEAQPTSTFGDFLKLGIEHILTGYDHLLFLFSLLVITRNFWPALKIITFFTLAHSITLALAGMSIANAPSSVVEPLIAATIVYVGLENIIRKDKVTTNQRCMLTFFFGLIHGFGFAGVLQEMNISSIETGILVPLFSFNLGVELGQIAVASIVLPLIWWLHKKERIERFMVPVGSFLTCMAGGYWLIERTLLN